MFKTIDHYPNYEVDTNGLVRNKSTGHIMKWVNNGKGYYSVKLYNSTTPKGRMCLVHRLVMSTHTVPPVNMDVNHINGDKGDNSIGNLEWVSKSDNTRHAHLTGLFKNRLTIEQVKQIKLDLLNETHFATLAKRYGVSRSTIWKIYKGILYDYV